MSIFTDKGELRGIEVGGTIAGLHPDTPWDSLAHHSSVYKLRGVLEYNVKWEPKLKTQKKRQSCLSHSQENLRPGSDVAAIP